MSDAIQTLRNNIILLRAQKRLTQHALAKQAGLAQSTLAHIESRSPDVSVGTVEKIARALEIDPAVLLFKKMEIV